MKYIGDIFKILCVILLSLFVVLILVLGIENKETLTLYLFGEYPAQGEYWIEFYETEDNTLASVLYIQDIYKRTPIDTENLLLATDQINQKRTIISEDLIWDEEKIKEYLLGHGYATIIDESKATESERRYQENAKENQIGCWAEPKSVSSGKTGQKNDEWTILKLISSLKNFVASKIFFLIRCLLGLVGISTILGVLIKFLRRNHMNVFFWGEIASGKTTILKRLENPYITKSALLEITSSKGRAVTVGKRIAVGKKDVHPRLIDNSGQAYEEIFDNINKKFFTNPHRMLILTIALSPKGNTIDRTVDKDYLQSGISKAAQILRILSGSSTIKTIKTLIVFINKCDLIYDNELLMINDRHKKVDELLKETYDYEMLEDIATRYSSKIHFIYGSAVEGWGVHKIEEIVVGDRARNIGGQGRRHSGYDSRPRHRSAPRRY